MGEIRFDSASMRDDQREELIAWVRTLGVDPDDVRTKGVILVGEQHYELHLSKFVRDSKGKMTVDWASEEVVTVPLVVPLGTSKAWPVWLGEPQ